MKIYPVQCEATDSGWFATLGKVESAQVLEHEIDCDWLVVGGGWMGLHATRRLAELDPQARIVLVDAGRIGNNAAGRCAGYAIDLAHNPRKKNFAEDVTGNREENHINLEGIAYMRQAVEELGVECDWSAEGKYHAAATDRGEACLHGFADALNRLEQDYQWIDADEIREITGSRHYNKALFAPGTVLLQPAQYLRNAMQALPDNVTVFENTPIVEMENGKQQVLCKTPSGLIRPGKVLLCNNGYLTKCGFFENTAIPLYTYASLTRPLTKNESSSIGGRETFGVIPADSFGTTLRRTVDNRLFLRNVYAYARDFKSTMADVEGAKRKHQVAFERRYPGIASMGFEHSWGGMMALSNNGGMVFGKLADNVFGTAFCNGTGVSRGTTFGKALAEYAMGKSSRSIEILLNRVAPDRGYPAFLTELGVRLTTKWRFYRAGLET
jgi:glycine/D-amino acid oxidase-like deaminating enzyme